MIADKPNWWYCNQNEYGAYRYEALNTKVSRKQSGEDVEFAIQLIQPIEFGGRIPLLFRVEDLICEFCVCASSRKTMEAHS